MPPPPDLEARAPDQLKALVIELLGEVAQLRQTVVRQLAVAVPAEWRFKGHETYLVQDLVLSVQAIRYQRERWLTPDGRTIIAPLPEGTTRHFGPELRRFVLMLYHQGHARIEEPAALPRPAACRPYR